MLFTQTLPVSSTEEQRSKQYWTPLFTIKSLFKSTLLHFIQAINWEDWCLTLPIVKIILPQMQKGPHRSCRMQGTFASDSKMQVLKYSRYSPPSDNHSEWRLRVCHYCPVKLSLKIPKLVSAKLTLEVESQSYLYQLNTRERLSEVRRYRKTTFQRQYLERDLTVPNCHDVTKSCPGMAMGGNLQEEPSTNTTILLQSASECVEIIGARNPFIDTEEHHRK